jgi:hypothetical protein
MGTLIVGNLIGTDAVGVNPIPTLNGISAAWFDGVPTSTMIGGALPGEGNVIAFTERVGVSVAGSVSGVSIRGNAIFENGGLGISIASGGNGNQPAPALVAATTSATTVIIDGSFDGAPNALQTIEFFANAECDPSGFGEGERFLGSIDVTTDGAGHADFTAVLDAVAFEGEVLTATATAGTTGNTSTFSACVGVTAAANPCDFDGDGDVDLADFAVLSQCFGGSNNPPRAGCPPGVDADLDDDADVDLADFAIFSQGYTGSL